ncbi:MAG: cell division protein ZapB [Deltaproteobacteria bacterium]|nr:cell division protein ZapB [Deltaproteobacteria bacterium]
MDNFERLEKEVERLIEAYAKLKNDMMAIRANNQDRSQEMNALERRVSKLEEDRRLALKKIDQLLEQLNQIDLG